MKARQWTIVGIVSLFTVTISSFATPAASSGPFSVAPLPQPYASAAQEPELFQLDDEPSVLDLPREYSYRSHKRKAGGKSGKMVVDLFHTVLSDIFWLNVNIFTWNTFKIIAATFPVFVASRMIDDRIHSHFYDASCHKNINQLPNWCQALARASIGLPILVLGLDAFFAKDDERRWTSQILLLGIPFVIWAKKIVKLSEFDGCQRPWNEFFDCDTRSYGGFPSGHMAQALYMTVLFGMRYGPKLAIPLGLIASFIGVSFISCNRHYLSQVIAGAAFGSIYAMAASKLVDTQLADRVDLRINVDEHGRPAFSAGVSW